MQAHLGTIVCKFCGDRVTFVVEEAILVYTEKCPYHVTFDLDLEHTLDAGSSGDHRVQVWWRSCHVCGRSSDLRKKVYRRTDRRTPHDCISSWNELKMCKWISKVLNMTCIQYKFLVSRTTGNHSPIHWTNSCQQNREHVCPTTYWKISWLDMATGQVPYQVMIISNILT